MINKIFAVLFPLLSLAGCALNPVANNVPPGTNIKRAAVISMTAREFSRTYTGLTAFNNEFEELDAKAWKVDQAIEEFTRGELQKLGIATVFEPYSDAEFSKVNDLNGPYAAPMFWGPNWSHIEAPALRYCKANNLDALIVIAKSTTGDFIAGTNQSFGGAGIYGRGALNNLAVIHLISYMGAISCATGKPLATLRVSTRPGEKTMEILAGAPLANIPIAETKTPTAQWSADQVQKYKETLVSFSRPAIRSTLSKLLNKSP